MRLNRLEDEVDITFTGVEELPERLIIEILSTESVIGKYGEIGFSESQSNPVLIGFIA